MIVDREPTANIAVAPALTEGLPVRTVFPKVPEVFNKAFAKEPLDFLDPTKSVVLPIGRNRFYSKLSLGIRKKGKDSLDRLKRGGRSRRCGNCRERHSSYEKCQEGVLSGLVPFKLTLTTRFQ